MTWGEGGVKNSKKSAGIPYGRFLKEKCVTKKVLQINFDNKKCKNAQFGSLFVNIHHFGVSKAVGSKILNLPDLPTILKH